MPNLIKELLKNGPVITDGAWGTELQARGLAIGEFPDAWNLSHPDRVLAVAQDYVEAGSQIILTNTFGANRIRLSEAGLDDKAIEINRAGVEISRRAANKHAFVFASIGPSGKLLANEDADAEALRLAFSEQARALATAGADAIVVETMSDIEEAVIAVNAAQATGLPVVACMVFDSGRDKDRTMMGTSVGEAVRTLTSAGTDVIGANCGQGIAGFLGICKQLRAATDHPIWLKPNAGLPQLVEGRAMYTTTPEDFSSFVPELIKLGADFVGGCCGTRPDFIRALKRKITGMQPPEP